MFKMSFPLVFILIGTLLILTAFFGFFFFLRVHWQERKSKPRKSVVGGKGEKTLQEALSKTRQPLLKGLHLLNLSKKNGALKAGSVEMEQLEELLYASDMGPKVAKQLLSVLEKDPSTGEFSSDGMKQKLKEEMLNILAPIDVSSSAEFHFASSHPSVWLFMGVNGAGKTTTVGKLAAQLAEQNKQVLVAASDTFRAAADKQLEVWTQRAQVHLFNPPQTKDPAAVAFDAVARAKAKNMDVVLVDTAGRLHTYDHLMQELEKIKRVIAKQIPSAPHESLLVLDANSGQNALHQARQFLQRMELTGVILTKLDSSAKGGIVFALASELQLPVKRIGIGEGLKDLRSFSAKEFVSSILEI